jgi:hypothetical protein
MDILESTASYEKWIREYIRIIDTDLAQKHQHMAGNLFEFFRATYYRWAQVWPSVSKTLPKAPKALAVGDLHVENFGTWRDAEGRLIWGINDFDEATQLPYTSDLIRLASSAHLAIASAKLAIKRGDVCEALLAGYTEGLKKGGQAYVLAESNLELRKLAVERLKNPGVFWKKLSALPTWKGQVPNKARKAMMKAMPGRGLKARIVHRIAGLGSLGRERLVTLGEWKGALVAREAKALAPSAALWAGNSGSTSTILDQKILDAAVRCEDPFVGLRDGWVIRRLAPDCSRIELIDLPDGKDERYLAYCMGFETANVHLGTQKAKTILGHLKSAGKKWLDESAQEMVKSVEHDWKKWAEAHGQKKKAK